MDARAWRVAAGAGTALLGILALVVWRSDALAGGWLEALRASALLAVAGLLASVLLAGRQGSAPAPRREVVVRVPPTGAPSASVRPAAGAALVQRALLLAVLSAAPVLVVLVLAPAADPPPGLAGRPLTGTAPPARHAAPTAPGTSTPVSSPHGPGQSTQPGASAPAAGPPTGTARPAPPGPTGPPATGPPATGPPAPGPPVLDSAGARAPGACQRTVLEGDTLWSIAAEQLGPGATVAQVVDRWHAVYARNAAGVGPDPDLIRPGLVLRSC